MSNYKLILTLLVIALIAALAGCASPTATVQPTVQATTPPATPTPGTGPSASATPAAQPAQGTPSASVEIKNLAFSPTEVTIAAPGNVTWTNGDAFEHTVTFTGEQSNQIGSGKSYTRTFDKPGTYEYVCSIHPSMKGKVIVT